MRVDRARIRGAFEMRVIQHGRIVMAVRETNLVVDAGLNAVARLIGGQAGAPHVDTIGFGTSGVAVAAADVALTAGLTRAIGAVTYPEAGHVRFAWELPENEGNGTTIREFGLLAGAVLIARKVRAPLDKTAAISLQGAWTLLFG